MRLWCLVMLMCDSALYAKRTLSLRPRVSWLLTLSSCNYVCVRRDLTGGLCEMCRTTVVKWFWSISRLMTLSFTLTICHTLWSHLNRSTTFTRFKDQKEIATTGNWGKVKSTQKRQHTYSDLYPPVCFVLIKSNLKLLQQGQWHIQFNFIYIALIHNISNPKALHMPRRTWALFNCLFPFVKLNYYLGST